MTRDVYNLLSERDATAALNKMNRNDVRAAATALWSAAGADFDGNNLSLLHAGEWKMLHSDMNRALERSIAGL